jgi:hypothetical protein
MVYIELLSCLLLVQCVGRKHRNEICFNGKTVHSNRNTILLTISLLQYWLGHVKDSIGQATQAWMPADLAEIPLQEWDPAKGQIVAVDVAGNIPERVTDED